MSCLSTYTNKTAEIWPKPTLFMKKSWSIQENSQFLKDHFIFKDHNNVSGIDILDFFYFVF